MCHILLHINKIIQNVNPPSLVSHPPPFEDSFSKATLIESISIIYNLYLFSLHKIN